ncbi:serine/threonine-protein kinase [Streptomyces cadmiisoli]|uniref:serine/threonine-protein kinase n=1 Tax=Streptomyces cadmiisoli TaxID=2184053 RepID=UPI00364ACE04
MLDEGAVPAGQGHRRTVSGRYQLLSALGTGGMGTVWRAYDQVLHREVAVKEVKAPDDLPASEIERMHARLEREAWAAARICHPNVVTVYDVAKEDGRPWIVMELIRGSSMADLLKAEGALTPRRAAHVAVEVLAALRAAHAAGVLHRDVKPANVLVAQDGRVVLTDFGIATLEGTSALTVAGEMVGSPEFLAPERALGQALGPASDLWSLGILLYAAVEGRSPFRQTTPLVTLRAIVEDDLPPASQAGPLAPVIAALLQKNPDERLAAEQAHQKLCAIRDGHATDITAHPVTSQVTTPIIGAPVAPRPDRRRRRTTVLGVSVAALLLVGGGLTYTATNGAGQESGAPQAKPEASRSAGSVEVSVSGERSAYQGSCPPFSDNAPTFTATFTVDRTPAVVSYRWVTDQESLIDEKWQTLSFAADDETTKSKSLDFSSYYAESFRTFISVEVRKPQAVRTERELLVIQCTEG